MARRFSRVIALVTVVSCLVCTRALAAPVLDQHFDPATLTGVTAAGPSVGTYYNAQTFTVGTTGQLTGVAFLANARGTTNIVIDVRPTSGGAPVGPNAQALASVSLAPSTIGSNNFTSMTYTLVDLTSFNINVTAGDVLALVAYLPGDNFDWEVADEFFTTPAATYAGGKRYHRGDTPSGAFSSLTQDLYFRTYVDASAQSTNAPEPATLALFGLALAGLGFGRLRRA